MNTFKRIPLTEFAAGTNRHFCHSILTNAPPAAIWAIWIDVLAWPQWDHELRGAQLCAQTPDAAPKLALNVKGYIQPLSGPRTHFEVTHWAPQNSYTLRFKLPLGAIQIMRTLAQADPQPGTVFKHEVQFLGLSGPLFAAILGKRFRLALPVVMRRIAELAESKGR